MFEYEDRAMFVAEPANDRKTEAHSPLEAIATADRYVDTQLAWLGAFGLIATLLFAVFIVSSS